MPHFPFVYSQEMNVLVPILLKDRKLKMQCEQQRDTV